MFTWQNPLPLNKDTIKSDLLLSVPDTENPLIEIAAVHARQLRLLPFMQSFLDYAVEAVTDFSSEALLRAQVNFELLASFRVLEEPDMLCKFNEEGADFLVLYPFDENHMPSILDDVFPVVRNNGRFKRADDGMPYRSVRLIYPNLLTALKILIQDELVIEEVECRRPQMNNQTLEGVYHLNS